MARVKWSNERFGQRVRHLREEEGWTQPQMAEKLAEHGLGPMHVTTITKIETGTRAVRIDEAIGIAALFEVTVDALVGSHGPDDTTLMFALMNVSDYIDNVKAHLGRARRDTMDVLEMLEDATQRFDEPVVSSMNKTALALDRTLDLSYEYAASISSSAMQAAIETPPRSAPRRRPRKAKP